MMHEQAQSGFVPPLALGEGKGFADKTPGSLTQRVVPTLDVAGLTRASAAGAVGAPGKDLVVGQPPVAARGTATIIGREALTQSAGTIGRTIPDEVCDHLAGLAAQGDPHPARVGLGAHEAPEFIEFEHVAFFGWQERVAQWWETCRFFSSHLATVCRATPKTRSAARSPNRSTSTARRISALRAGSMAGLLAWSTRCAPQALQRYCGVPEPLWPALTMDVLAHVAQQGAEIFTLDHRRKKLPCHLSINHYPNPAQHMEGVPKLEKANAPFHPEEYQDAVHEADYATIKGNPKLWGSFLWVMFDFPAAPRQEGGTTGLNDKGLVTQDRQLKKDAFYFYQANWSEVPTVYIASRRLTPRHEANTQVRVCSSCAEVELNANEKPFGKVEKDPVNVYRWENVALQPRVNRIEVTGRSGGKTVIDRCEWVLENVPPAPSS